MKFSLFQKEEILHKLNTRRDIIKMDPDSADEWETVTRLDLLIVKVESLSEQDYSPEEIKEIKDEIENSLDIAEGNLFFEEDQDEPDYKIVKQIKSDIRKYKLLITKLERK